MSDAMTNREIEDVLTSIRRLVAQDGGRIPDRQIDRPAEASRAEASPGPGADPARRAPGRLILTDAQRVDPAAPPEAGEIDTAQAEDATGLPVPDFGRLEATIAELEAAVSASGGNWDADNSDEQPRASNVTDLYGRLPFAPRREGDVEPDTDAAPLALPESTTPPETPAEPALPGAALPPATHSGVALDSADSSTDDVAADGDAESDTVFQLPPAPATMAEPETGETILDEAGFQALVAQIVRDELHGQLGERITAQVRKLVRAEIAKALDERKFL